MKRKILLLVSIIMFSCIGQSQKANGAAMVEPSDFMFKSVLDNMGVSDTSDDTSPKPLYYYDDDREFQEINSEQMPMFKQLRLKLSNKILEKQYQDKKELSTSSKFRFWKSKNTEEQEKENVININDLNNSIEEETSAKITDETISLEGGVSADETEKQMILDAQNLNFDEETGEIIATGRPVMDFPPQNIKIIADKFTYNEESNILKGIGNVIVYRDNTPIKGDFIEVNMNEETMIMDNILAIYPTMNATAQHSIQKDGLLILEKGTLYSEKSSINRLATRMIGPKFERMIVDKDSKELFFGSPEGNKITVNLKDVKVDARRDHDVFKAKGIEIKHGDRTFFKWPSLTLYTNKQHDYFDGNYPEFGSRRKLGMFLGPGFAFGAPNGAIIKIIPFINYKKDFGIGGMVKYTHNYNHTFFGYGSANDLLFLKGKQRLDDNLYLQYGVNTFSDEYFLGNRMAKYMAEVYYDKTYLNKDFLAEGLNLTFRQRAGFGFMRNDDTNSNGEHMNTSNMSTTRTRYMAGLDQVLFNHENRAQRFKVQASLTMQGSAALYGTGDTQFIARIGPKVHVQYKNWMQDVGYFLTGYDDKTPMPVYDKYRYGRQSVYLTETFRLTKYVSVGWAGYINLSDDSPNGKMFQENAFLVSLGPDDLKVILGYDFSRQRTYFGVNVAFDPKGTTVNYDKMTIKNPERLGKRGNPDEEDKEQQVAFVNAKPRPEIPSSARKSRQAENSKPKVLQYAQVIEIEDPIKERID